MAKKSRMTDAVEAGPSYKPYKSPEDRKTGPFDDYEVRNALETLTKAKKIERNKALMRAVRVEAKKQLDAAQGNLKTLTNRS